MPRLITVMAVLLLVAVSACVRGSTRGSPPAQEFAVHHWRAPIAPQGPPPAGFTAQEASLHPEDCGACHPAQLADWRTSLHAASMGPGVAGQLVEMFVSDPVGAVGCLRCHAPLAEQAPLIRSDRGLIANPDLDAALLRQGIPCAGCHVRRHERFGPPRRDGSLASAPPATLPHRGATRTPAFVRSEFCESCHQFAPDGPALNGKLLEDTFREWQASRFAAAGVQCQDCHMPDRRHRWRGIHDAEMVRSGVTITAETGAPRYRPGDTATARLRVENTGVGHAFPTYVTPRVVLSAELLDANGVVVAGSREERVIAREVTLDLSRELSDTRLLPGEGVSLSWRRAVDRPGLRLRFRVIVEPDAFYTPFFETLLANGAGAGTDQIRAALEATRRSPFTVFERDVPLT